MNKVLLHISHTEIRKDSRILKELLALESLDEYERVAIGVESNEGSSASMEIPEARIVSIRLFTELLSVLPRITIVKVLRSGLKFLELTFAFFFRGIALKPKVVHCHDTLVLPAGVLIKFATGCKLVYDAHELESDKNGQTPLLSKATLFTEKMCWRSIDLLVSVSDSIIAWYIDNVGHKDHLLVLNSPKKEIERSGELQPASTGKYFHQLYGIPNRKKLFVYLGVLASGRGIEIILSAFAHNSTDAHVVFAGYGDLSDYIQSYCEKHSNIHLHKPVPHEQVVSLAKHADFGLCLIEKVSLSDYYCLPNKLFEYSFAGLPVLASDFPEIKKVVEKYSLGVCCAPKSEQIRESIDLFVNRSPSNPAKGISELSWNKQAARLLFGYRKLLNIEMGIETCENEL